MEDNNHPIWSRFNTKDNDTNLAICVECNIEIEIQDMQLAPLEMHLNDTHKEIFQL